VSCCFPIPAEPPQFLANSPPTAIDADSSPAWQPRHTHIGRLTMAADAPMLFAWRHLFSHAQPQPGSGNATMYGLF
jgi:hypothetical protein